MLTIKDIAWVAGLIEGEGCFTFNKGTPRLAIDMTDKDVLDKLASFIGGTVNGPYPRKKRNGEPAKDAWELAIYGKHAAGWAMTIYDMMGCRRKLAIEVLVSRWKKNPVTRWGNGKSYPRREDNRQQLYEVVT
jgi:hypothetical protein